MKKGDVILGRLVPAHQDAPETVQPTVRAFHHPAPGLEPSLPLDGFRLIATAADVGGETELLPTCGAPRQSRNPCPGTFPGVARGLGAGRGTATLSNVARTSFISWRLAPSTARPTRDALGFGQHAALDAPFTPVGGVGAGFSPRPRAIWSWRRPYSANSSPAPSVRHSVPDPLATAPRTPRRQPIAESAGGRWTRKQMPVASNAFHWQPVRNT